MPTSRLVQWGAIGGVIAGLAWGASAVIATVVAEGGEPSVGSLSGYLFELSHAFAEWGMLVWLVGSHARQSPSYGRLGTMGFVVSFVGTTLLCLITLLYVLTGEAPSETFYTTAFVLALLVSVAGIPLLGIAIFRAKVMPRWCGVLLVGHLFLLFLAIFTGIYDVLFTLLGLLWLALAYALWTQRDMPAEQPSRVM
jgi:hypothetical protein